MAAGDMSFSIAVAGAPSFECGPCLNACSSSDTLNLVLSGTIQCTGCLVGPMKITLLTVPDTAVVTGGAGTWTVSGVGAITADVYDVGCGTPTGDTFSDTLTITITCDGGFYSGRIDAFIGTDHELSIFFDNSGRLIGDPLTNLNICDTDVEGGKEGIITIAEP